jgi:hypothetical protein
MNSKKLMLPNGAANVGLNVVAALCEVRGKESEDGTVKDDVGKEIWC